MSVEASTDRWGLGPVCDAVQITRWEALPCCISALHRMATLPTTRTRPSSRASVARPPTVAEGEQPPPSWLHRNLKLKILNPARP